MCSSILTRKTISRPLNGSTFIIYWITLSVLFTGSSLGDSISEDADIEESVSNIVRHLFPMVPDKGRTPWRDNSFGVQLLLNNRHHHHLPNHLPSQDNLYSSSIPYQGGEGDIDGGGGGNADGGGGGGGDSSVGVNGFNSDIRGLSTDDFINTDSQHHIYPNQHYHHHKPFVTSSRNIGIESRSHPYNIRDSSSNHHHSSSSSMNNLIKKLVSAEEARESAMAAAGYSDINLADFSSTLPFKSSSSSSSSSKSDSNSKETESLLSSLSSSSVLSSPATSSTSPSSSSGTSPSSSSSSKFSSSSSMYPSNVKIITSRTPSGLNGRGGGLSNHHHHLNNLMGRSPILPSTSIQHQQLAAPRKPRVIGSAGPGCMRRCINQGILHPLQCHSLC